MNLKTIQQTKTNIHGQHSSWQNNKSNIRFPLESACSKTQPLETSGIRFYSWGSYVLSAPNQPTVAKHWLTHTHGHTHTHTHTRLTALCLGLHEWAGITKVNQFGLYRKDSKWQWHQLGYMRLHLTSDRQPHQYRTTQSFLQAGCPSCYLTNSAKALKETQNTDPKKWLGLICSSFTRIQQTVHTVLGVYLKTYLFVCY